MKSKAKSDENNGIKLERFIGVIGIVLSLIALFFSWQANQIASQQIKDNVFSPSSIYEWATYEQEHSSVNSQDFVCIQRTRLSNLGGANSTIIKYDSTLYFKGKSATVSGEQEYVQNTAQLENFISGFRVEFVDGKTLETNSSGGLFPVAIPSNSTVDIWTKVKFAINANLESIEYFYPPYDYYSFLEQGAKYHDFSPMEISFTFTTASGKTVITPKALCIFVK